MEMVEQVLARFGGRLADVYRASVEEPAIIQGIGEATAVRNKSALIP